MGVNRRKVKESCFRRSVSSRLSDLMGKCISVYTVLVLTVPGCAFRRLKS